MYKVFLSHVRNIALLLAAALIVLSASACGSRKDTATTEKHTENTASSETGSVTNGDIAIKWGSGRDNAGYIYSSY